MNIDLVRSMKSSLLGEVQEKWTLDTLEDYFLDAMDLMLADYGLAKGEGYTWQGDDVTVRLYKKYDKPTGRELFNRVVITGADEKKDNLWDFPPKGVDQKFYLDHLDVIKGCVSRYVVGAEIGEDIDVLDEAWKKEGKRWVRSGPSVTLVIKEQSGPGVPIYVLYARVGNRVFRLKGQKTKHGDLARIGNTWFKAFDNQGTSVDMTNDWVPFKGDIFEDIEVMDEAGPDFKDAAKVLLGKSTGRSQDDLHYRAYLRAIIDGKPAGHLVKKFKGAKMARQALIDMAGKSKYEDSELDTDVMGESEADFQRVVSGTGVDGSGVPRSYKAKKKPRDWSARDVKAAVDSLVKTYGSALGLKKIRRFQDIIKKQQTMVYKKAQAAGALKSETHPLTQIMNDLRVMDDVYMAVVDKISFKESTDVRHLRDALLGEGELTEGFTLSPGDKKVIKAFIDKKPLEGRKLDTDGKKLDGMWMGGRGQAEWRGGKIVLRDQGGKSSDVIHRFIRKNAPRNWIAEGVELDEAVVNIMAPNQAGPSKSAAGKFAKKLEATIKKHMPPGHIQVIRFEVNKYKPDQGQIYLVTTLQKPSEWTNGIIQNDPALQKFFIDGFTADGQVGAKLKAESIGSNSLMVKPEPGSRDYASSAKFGWRKKVGTAEQMLKHFDSYYTKVARIVKANKNNMKEGLDVTGLRDALLNEAGLTPGSVKHFLLVLASKITQADRREMRKGQVNPNRLAHWLKAATDAGKPFASHGDSTDRDTLLKLKKSVAREFTPDFSPANYVKKAIDQFIATGKAPKLTGSAGTKLPWKESVEDVMGEDAMDKLHAPYFAWMKSKASDRFANEFKIPVSKSKKRFARIKGPGQIALVEWRYGDKFVRAILRYHGMAGSHGFTLVHGYYEKGGPSFSTYSQKEIKNFELVSGRKGTSEYAAKFKYEDVMAEADYALKLAFPSHTKIKIDDKHFDLDREKTIDSYSEGKLKQYYSRWSKYLSRLKAEARTNPALKRALDKANQTEAAFKAVMRSKSTKDWYSLARKMDDAERVLYSVKESIDPVRAMHGELLGRNVFAATYDESDFVEDDEDVMDEAYSSVSIPELKAGLKTGKYRFMGVTDSVAGLGIKYYVIRDVKAGIQMQYLKIKANKWMEKYEGVEGMTAYDLRDALLGQ